jgi:hypothetical protein
LEKAIIGVNAGVPKVNPFAMAPTQAQIFHPLNSHASVKNQSHFAPANRPKRRPIAMEPIRH